jgi:N-acetylglutamate synthase-like GNAT family acetyltransferase
MFTVRLTTSADDLEQAFKLRWEVLRKPWNQPRGSEQDEQEATSFTAIAQANGITVATGRVQLISPLVAQIRYMAVHPEWQGKGAGRQVLHLLEKQAGKLGAEMIVLNARENAISFYQRNGYQITGNADMLYGVIRHVRMEKKMENR